MPLSSATRASVIAVCMAGLFILAPSAYANPSVYEPATDPGLGFNLIAWSGNSGTSWSNAIDALYNAGFREVSISPVRRFDNNTGAVISNFGYPSLTAVDAGVLRAKQLGMRVTLNPFVELSNLPGGQSWRAYFAPLPGSTVANTFWPAYESYLDEVATIAQNRGVDAMNVGTEMKGLDSFYKISDFDPVTGGKPVVADASPAGSAESLLGHGDRFSRVDLQRPDRLRSQLGQFQFHARHQQYLVASRNQLHRHRFVLSIREFAVSDSHERNRIRFRRIPTRASSNWSPTNGTNGSDGQILPFAAGLANRSCSPSKVINTITARRAIRRMRAAASIRPSKSWHSRACFARSTAARRMFRPCTSGNGK